MSDKPVPRLDLMPSAADRWMTCPASPRFCLENADLIPTDTSSKFSDEGTSAHEVAAAFLQDREPKPENCPTPIDGDMRWHGFSYAEYVNSLRHPDAGMSKLIVEEKQPLWFYEGRNAVIDAAVINPESLHIVDYKYGVGVPVSPVENRQTIIYARQVAGKLTIPFDFPITTHIYQPRNRESDEPAKTWETDWRTIKKLSDEIADHAFAIINNHKLKNPPMEFHPSEKACRWCPAKSFCPAHSKELLGDFEEIMDEPSAVLAMPAALTAEQLAKVLKYQKRIEKFLTDAEEYARARMLEGHEIPGFKMVKGKEGNRYWSDPQKAAKLLIDSTILKRNEVIEESIISVAGVEKLIGKRKLSAELTNLIARAPGGPTIAPADDPRESIVVRAENEFSALPERDFDELDDY